MTNLSFFPRVAELSMLWKGQGHRPVSQFRVELWAAAWTPKLTSTLGSLTPEDWEQVGQGEECHRPFSVPVSRAKGEVGTVEGLLLLLPKTPR